jgi:hypothetical protein
MPWDIFGTQARQKVHTLIAASEKRSDDFHALRSLLEQQKNEQIKRQVDLWSVPTMSTEIEEEYYAVSLAVTQFVKKIGAYDEYLDDLRAARTSCAEQGHCDALAHLLEIPDPWLEKVAQGKQDALPRVVGTK